MGALAIVFLLAGPAQQTDCRPQFAPLHTGTYSGASRVPFWRKTEAGEWGGSGWLGWARESDRLPVATGQRLDQLQPVELIVRDRPKDFPDDDENVTVQAIPEVRFAIRCIPGLTVGPIQTVGIANGSLGYDGPFLFTLGTRQYGIYLV